MKKKKHASTHNPRATLSALALAGISLTATQGLRAAEGTPPTPGSERGALEEVTVTAQRREQNLQSVPIAVSALTAQTLENTGVTGTEYLQTITPGLVWGTSQAGAIPSIRGVGTNSAIAGGESIVSVYVDGVYYPSQAAGIFSFSDVDRIEVLKGPQGTLFGRNATAGLVHVITRTPSHETSGNLEVGYGKYDTTTAKGYFTTGIADNLATNVSAYYSDQGDGWGKNLTLGNDVNRSREFAVRSKSLLTVGENTDFTFSGDYYERRGDKFSVRAILPGTIGFAGVRPRGTIYDTLSEIPYIAADAESWGVALQGKHRTSRFDFVSITSYREATGLSVLDQDQTQFPSTYFLFHKRDESFTQELQLQSANTEGLQWIVGAFYMDLSGAYLPTEFRGTTTNPNFATYATQTNQSISGFGQVTVPFLLGTNLTAGARYTSDDLELDHRGAVIATGVETVHVRISEKQSKPTWRLSLDRRFSDEFMGYVSYNRGFKSGTYNTGNDFNPSVRPEVLDAIEIGLKSDLLGERLRLNGAAFYYDYSDLQVQVTQQGLVQILNAAGAEVFGIDLDATAALSRSLAVRSGFAWVPKAEYTSFNNTTLTVPRPTGGNATVIGDATGNRLNKAPEWTASVGADWKLPLAGGGQLLFSGTYYYNSGYAWRQDNRVKTSHYELVNARISYTSASDVTVALWGNNLSEAVYPNQIGSGGTGDNIAPAEPRTYGFSLGIRF